ncbi:MAG: Asp-tRNA(Asn)/Glu-tRNA(Gln) amidotransferase subunit GatA [Methanomassiliicoccus sp.]|nr:Asp-tRNA(Asn)/Glu-tRNA(Gln) amidotransferase subunit GatA [Methanomassiliicoccus sp.]
MTSFPTMDRLQALDERHLIFCDRLEDPLALEQGSFHFSAKDNLCSRDFQTRSGSRILNGYRPPFDATPIKRLREMGGLLLGKTNMDEFGFGSFSTNSGYGVPRNPFDTQRCCGGSSGGAAAAAALIPEHLALGVSTGGSISCPASFCGVVGLTPTYGRVSRWGLIDYGNSLDKVGLLTRTAHDLERYLPAISGPDPKDPTSLVQPPLDLRGDVGTIGVPAEARAGLSPEVAATFDEALKELSRNGVKVREVRMPSLRFSIPAYYVLATSEASTNLARYCGMRYGEMNEEFDQGFNDFFTDARSEHFGPEAKRRILLGTYSRMVGFRDRYYVKALQVRQLIIDEYRRTFEDCDAVLTPTMPFVAPRFDEIGRMSTLEMYQADFLTSPPNLAGMPHLSVPCGYSGGMPVGMQLVAPQWNEGRLISFARFWEGSFHYRFPEVTA